MHQTVTDQNPIMFIRMITGEDILTQYEEKTLVFLNPLKVIYGMTPKQDGMIISLAQWVFDTVCEKQEFNVRREDILLIAEPTKEMVEYYQEALDRNSGKKRKIQQLTRKEIDSMSNEEDFEEMSEDEVELIKSVLDGLKDSKRKLH